jgi:hypothetical protein
LADNPYQRYTTDEEAIRAALRPGVSRKMGRVRSPQLTEKLLDEFPDQDPSLYDNSGYGLTFTSQLGCEAGQFSVVSGMHSVAYVNNHETIASTYHAGTAVRVVLHPSKIEAVINKVLPAGQNRGKRRSGSLLSASEMARLGLSSEKPKQDP